MGNRKFWSDFTSVKNNMVYGKVEGIKEIQNEK